MYLIEMQLKNGDGAIYVVEGKAGDVAMVRARRALRESGEKSDILDMKAHDLGGVACSLPDVLALAYPEGVIHPAEVTRH
jgi:hypothetical protein